MWIVYPTWTRVYQRINSQLILIINIVQKTLQFRHVVYMHLKENLEHQLDVIKYVHVILLFCFVFFNSFYIYMLSLPVSAFMCVTQPTNLNIELYYGASWPTCGASWPTVGATW